LSVRVTNKFKRIHAQTQKSELDSSHNSPHAIIQVGVSIAGDITLQKKKKSSIIVVGQVTMAILGLLWIRLDIGFVRIGKEAAKHKEEKNKPHNHKKPR
jgi:hypothetical protein